MGISNGIIISTEQSKNIEVEIIHRENSVQTFARLKCGLCYNVILAAGVLSKDSIFDSLFKINSVYHMVFLQDIFSSLNTILVWK